MCHVLGSYKQIIFPSLEIDEDAVEEDGQHNDGDFIVIEYCYNHVWKLAHYPNNQL